MKKISLFLLALGATLPAFAAPDLAEKIARQYLPLLQKLAGEKFLLREVRARNASPLTPEEAQKVENAWTEIGISDLEHPYLFNPATQVIHGYEYRIPPMFKCFVLDQWGNVVGTDPQSTHFIHGPMDKFLKCYNRGRVYINPPGLDVSTKIYSVQVSVPVFDRGRTIGVLVATLSLE